MRTISRAEPNSADHWMADFLGQPQRDDLAPATVCGYRYDLGQFQRWFNRAIRPSSSRLERLSAVDLIKYRQHLVKRGLRPATVNRRLEALRRFSPAQQSKRLKTNIALDLRPVRTVCNTRSVELACRRSTLCCDSPACPAVVRPVQDRAAFSTYR